MYTYWSDISTKIWSIYRYHQILSIYRSQFFFDISAIQNSVDISKSIYRHFKMRRYIEIDISSILGLGIGNWNEISINRQFKNDWYLQKKQTSIYRSRKRRRYIENDISAIQNGADISIYRQFKSWYMFILEIFPHTDTVTHT